MKISVAEQAVVFTGAVVLGLGVGVLYDLMRLLRRHVRLPLLGSVLDLLFWSITTIALFCFVVSVGDGEVRIYVLLAVLGGAVAYFLSLSAWILSLGELLVDGLAALFRCVLMPIRLSGRIIKKIRKKLKNLFLYRRKWYKIKATFERMEEVPRFGVAYREEGGCHAIRKSRTVDQSSDSRTSDCCGDLSAGTQQSVGSGSGPKG